MNLWKFWILILFQKLRNHGKFTTITNMIVLCEYFEPTNKTGLIKITILFRAGGEGSLKNRFRFWSSSP